MSKSDSGEIKAKLSGKVKYTTLNSILLSTRISGITLTTYPWQKRFDPKKLTGYRLRKCLASGNRVVFKRGCMI